MGADEGPCLVVMVDAEGAEVVVGRVATHTVDLVLVEALARLQLAARRRGCSIGLRHPSQAVCQLLDLVGLTELSGPPPGLPLEVGREPEGGEELGIEEVVPPRDPVTRDLDHLEGEGLE